MVVRKGERVYKVVKIVKTGQFEERLNRRKWK